MARDFVDAVDLSPSKDIANLSKGEYEYPCGLKLTEASITNIDSSHWSVSIAGKLLLATAHNVHHKGFGGGHDPTASLYFTSNSDGEMISATCSCLFDS